MFFRRTFKSLTICYHDLLQNFKSERIVIRFYKNCSRLNKKCYIREKSNKYV